MTDYPIRFNRPTLIGTALGYVTAAIERGRLSGDNFYTRRCHELLQQSLGVRKALLTTSCTHALEMAALLLEIGPGDEVIVPAFTFVSTVNAFVLRGARPVFADIRPDTLNLDETYIDALISSRTRAVVPVHYAGVGCEMDAILGVARRHGIAVVEDNAHGVFGKYGGEYLGTFGAMATLSFHETKNLTCGEGGALLINDERYSWVDIGSSYLPSDILAAYLSAQLESCETIQAKRKRVWHNYDERLRPFAGSYGITLPTVPPHCEQAYHMYYLLLPSLAQRSALIEHLKRQGILSVFHYLPLHLSEMGRRFGGKEGDCPVTEQVSDRLLRLPFYTDLTEADQERVVTAVCQFFEGS